MAAPERFADTPDSFPLHRGRRPYMALNGVSLRFSLQPELEVLRIERVPVKMS
jgi:hypothetical protein